MHLITWTAAAAACLVFSGCALTPTEAAPEADAAGVAVRRIDERRSEQPLSVDVLGNRIELGLSYELTQERRLGFDLERIRQRGRDTREHELKLDARGRAGASMAWFVQGVGLAERRRSIADGSVRKTSGWQRGQTWLLFDQIGGSPLTLQIGRIALIERRSWWWDDDVDALRLSATGTGWRIETGLAREVMKLAAGDRGIAPELKGLTRWFGQARWDLAKDHRLEGFWLVTSDRSGTPAPGTRFDEGEEDRSDGRLRWVGLRASGTERVFSSHRLSYRVDAALLRGRETLTAFDATAAGPLEAGASRGRTVRGHALDMGLQWRLPGEARPTFTLAWAQGSGGADTGGVDHNFRQTGLQENKGRVAGVKRVRYYGELLDPELSNLRIGSIGAGLRLLSNSSLEVLWHRYRQRVPSARLAGSRLSEAPLGLDGHIGDELDLLFAMREWRHLELTLRLARFRPGPAFASDRRSPAHQIEFGAALTF